MEKTRITIIAITGIVLFFLANYLCRFLLGLTGPLVSLILAVAIALYMAFSVAKSLARSPTAEEKSRMLWIYGGFLGALFVAFGAWLFMGEGFDSVTLATLLLHYLPYPALAHVCLSDGVMRRLLGKNRGS